MHECKPTPIGLEDIWGPWEIDPHDLNYERRIGLIQSKEQSSKVYGFVFNAWRAFYGDGACEITQYRISEYLSEAARRNLENRILAHEQRDKVKLSTILSERKLLNPERALMTSRMRFRVFRRDKYTCQYCGQKAPNIVLVVDHVIPIVKGGKTVIENLKTACEECNTGKFDMLPVEAE